MIAQEEKENIMLLNLNLKKQIIASNSIFGQLCSALKMKKSLLLLEQKNPNIIEGKWWRNVISDAKKSYNVLSLNVI